MPVYMATHIYYEDDVHIYGEHFGRPALAPLGSYDALVQRFDSGGSFAGARLFGGAAIDHPSAMTVHAGVVLITGAARITKHDTPNQTMEWDIAMMRGRVDEASPLEYRTIDLARDDFGWALAKAPDGRLIVGGRTNYVQVDTNSEVENGKGLLLTLGPDLSRQAVLELPMPRDVQVRALASPRRRPHDCGDSRRPAHAYRALDDEQRRILGRRARRPVAPSLGAIGRDRGGRGHLPRPPPRMRPRLQSVPVVLAPLGPRADEVLRFGRAALPRPLGYVRPHAQRPRDITAGGFALMTVAAKASPVCEASNWSGACPCSTHRSSAVSVSKVSSPGPAWQ